MMIPIQKNEIMVRVGRCLQHGRSKLSYKPNKELHKQRRLPSVFVKDMYGTKQPLCTGMSTILRSDVTQMKRNYFRVPGPRNQG